MLFIVKFAALLMFIPSQIPNACAKSSVCKILKVVLMKISPFVIIDLEKAGSEKGWVHASCDFISLNNNFYVRGDS